MNSITPFTALSMGFAGSLHCAGMCGPIMLIMPFQQMSGWKKAAGIALYHFGRITVYALMGFILYSFKSLFYPQWQQYISAGVGIILLAIGILSFYTNKVSLPWLQHVKLKLAQVIQKPRILPACSMVPCPTDWYTWHCRWPLLLPLP